MLELTLSSSNGSANSRLPFSGLEHKLQYARIHSAEFDLPHLGCAMRANGNIDAEKLKRLTERILYDTRREIRRMDLTENVARRNIREFLEHLPQFYDPDQNEPSPTCPRRNH